MCKFLGCLPSELYEEHNPTIGDVQAINAYRKILEEEENEKLRAITGGR